MLRCCLQEPAWRTTIGECWRWYFNTSLPVPGSKSYVVASNRSNNTFPCLLARTSVLRYFRLTMTAPRTWQAQLAIYGSSAALFVARVAVPPAAESAHSTAFVVCLIAFEVLHAGIARALLMLHSDSKRALAWQRAVCSGLLSVEPIHATNGRNPQPHQH